MGLLRLTELANADQLMFWGKIFTTSQPYYIAVAIDFKGNYAFPHKRFFYAYILKLIKN
jgi:radial spoke head protein 9